MPVFISGMNPKLLAGKAINAISSHEQLGVSQALKFAGLQEVYENPSIDYERFAKNYIESDPEILFLSEYIVKDVMCGILIVWEKFLDSTHYELFKRNLFQADSKFERILFLDTQSLEEERGWYIGYIRDTLGLNYIDEENTYIVLDASVKEDRIYEYKIAAARVPRIPEEVDYDMIMESKGLLNQVAIDETSDANIFTFSSVNLGSRDLAWMVSLVNENVIYFGRTSLSKPLANFVTPNIKEGQLLIYVPKSLEDPINILKDSMTIFSVKESFSHLLDVLGGLPPEFKKTFLEAIDEERNLFSYDSFKEGIRGQVPVFDMILDISESSSAEAIDKLSAMPVIVPSATGTEDLVSVVGLSKVFRFVNETMIAILYAQEEKNFEEIRKILAIVNIVDTTESVFNSAISSIRDAITGGSSDADADESNLLGVQQGEETDEKDSEDTGSTTLAGFAIR